MPVLTLVYWKRYSDIRKLYDTLQRYHQAIYRPGKFPDIPEKPRFLDRYDPVVVEERRVATRNFLNYALQHLYLRTHEAYVEFFQKGERVLLPDVHAAPLQPEVLNSQVDAAPDTIADLPLPASIDESTKDDILLTTAEEEQIDRVTHNCAQILADLTDLQFEQREEIKKENEEFNLIKQEVDEAAGSD